MPDPNVPTPLEHGVTVRAAREPELDAAGAAVRLAYVVDGLAHEPYLAVLANARDRAADAEVAVAVERSGQVLGSVTFALPGSRWAELCSAGEAEFRMLGVLPAARGKGIGAALVEWCIERAAATGSDRIVISSEQGMRAAHRIYLGRGFRRRPDLDWAPLPGVHLLGFSLELDGARAHRPVGTQS